MARLIQDRIKRAIADELLFGKLMDGGRVLLDVRDGELSVDTEAAEKLPAVVE
jgi:ATP-dependent Clp protease ATP-binding subunit ClpA